MTLAYLHSLSVIPLSIVGSRSFYDALINCLGLIGYYASAFGSIVLIEHLTMRKEYDMEIWNDPHRLPSMWPAIGAFILSFGLVILSMDQVWFKGPIAALGTGDIGFEIAFITAGPLYYGLRKLEHKFCSTVTK
jgi:purine-cytosine permease-like protein